MNSKETLVGSSTEADQDTSNWPENVTLDSDSDRSVHSCSESEHEEYWDVDEAELNQDFNIDEDDPNSAYDSTIKLIRVTTLFLLLWASFYSISASALQHLIKFLRYLFSTIMAKTPVIVEFAEEFPPSLYMLKKSLEFYMINLRST